MNLHNISKNKKVCRGTSNVASKNSCHRNFKSHHSVKCQNSYLNICVYIYIYIFTHICICTYMWLCILIFSSVAQSCPTLCDPMNQSTPGLPVHHQLPELTQTYVHWVSDAIQPSHLLSSPSPPAPTPSQHQGIFQWVNSAWGGQSTGVSASASVLPMNTQDWSPLGWPGWISLQSKGLSRVFSNTIVQKHMILHIKGNFKQG